MRTFTVPPLLLLIATAIACQDTPQPLAVDSESDLPSATLAGCERAPGNVLGRLPRGHDYDTKILVVTSNVIGQETVCLVDSDLYNVVVTGTAGGSNRAFQTTLAVPEGTNNLSPGDRFDVQSPSLCSASHTGVLLLPAGPS